MIRISKTELKSYLEKAFEEELYLVFSPNIIKQANVPPRSVLVRNLLNNTDFMEDLITDIEGHMVSLIRNSNEYYEELNWHKERCQDVKPISDEEANAVELLKRLGYSLAKKCQ